MLAYKGLKGKIDNTTYKKQLWIFRLFSVYLFKFNIFCKLIWNFFSTVFTFFYNLKCWLLVCYDVTGDTYLFLVWVHFVIHTRSLHLQPTKQYEQHHRIWKVSCNKISVIEIVNLDSFASFGILYIFHEQD